MNIARIPLTQGNINNNHFYLTGCLSLFPADSVGGRNTNLQALNTLRLLPLGGESVETDIDGEKNIFRKRGWVGEMFKRTKAKAGDHVVIEKHENGAYEICIDKAI